MRHNKNEAQRRKLEAGETVDLLKREGEGETENQEGAQKRPSFPPDGREVEEERDGEPGGQGGEEVDKEVKVEKEDRQVEKEGEEGAKLNEKGEPDEREEG